MLAIQTEDELRLVKEFLILPVMIEILDKDLQIVRTSAFKFPDLYVTLFLNVQDSIIRKQHSIRTEFKKLGIKVFETEWGKEHLQSKYLCRGYTQVMTIPWDRVRAESKIRLAKLLQLDMDDVRERGGQTP